jgi:hypothetical protein
MWQPLVEAVAKKAVEAGDPVPGRFQVPRISGGKSKEMGLPELFCFKEIADICRSHGPEWTKEALADSLDDKTRAACEAIIDTAFTQQTELTVRQAKDQFKLLREGKDREDEAAAVSLVMMLAFRKVEDVTPTPTPGPKAGNA